jgi:methylthioribose-1-phosphate isomerase
VKGEEVSVEARAREEKVEAAEEAVVPKAVAAGNPSFYIIHRKSAISLLTG